MPTVNWTGRSGWSYEFGVFDLLTQFKPAAGVYILCRPFQIGQASHLEALYVGEAQSLEDRLNTGRARHEGFQRALKMGATTICARLVPDGAAERLRIETDLRHAWDPPCNAEPVPGNALIRTTLRI